MKGADIISRARVLLGDEVTPYRWADAELVNWINDGCGLIALARPDSAMVNATMTLAAGTKQSIAALNPAGLRLIDVVRNAPNGRAIRLTTRDMLDATDPNWHAATAGPTRSYVFDNRDPKTFYVSPPAVAAAQVEIRYSRNPVVITTAQLGTVDLTPDDVFLDPLLNYVMSRALSKDAEAAMNVALAAGYREAFEGVLGIKVKADNDFSPAANSPGGT